MSAPERFSRRTTIGDLSPHFSSRELACPCCGRLVLWPRLLLALERLRRLAGRPVYVTSGYRCPEHNAEVGGGLNSRHLLGQAADIVIHGRHWREAYALALKVPALAEGGIGLYPEEGFVHVDVRRGRARWARKEGRNVAVEVVVG